MTAKQKEQIGMQKAVDLVKKLEENGRLKDITHFVICPAVSRPQWSTPYTLKLYNINRPKYKKNPVLKIEFGGANITNRAEACKIKELLKDRFEWGCPIILPNYTPPVQEPSNIPF